MKDDDDVCPRCGEKLAVISPSIQKSPIVRAKYTATILWACDKCNWVQGIGVLLDENGKSLWRPTDEDISELIELHV